MACWSETGLVPVYASMEAVFSNSPAHAPRNYPVSCRLLPGGDREQLVLRQNDQPCRLDAHRAVALEALELLVHPLARCAEQLREVFLRELQADADLLAVVDAV